MAREFFLQPHADLRHRRNDLLLYDGRTGNATLVSIFGSKCADSIGNGAELIAQIVGIEYALNISEAIRPIRITIAGDWTAAATTFRCAHLFEQPTQLVATTRAAIRSTLLLAIRF